MDEGVKIDGYQLKKREKVSRGIEMVTNCHRLKLKALDGKMRETDI